MHVDMSLTFRWYCNKSNNVYLTQLNALLCSMYMYERNVMSGGLHYIRCAVICVLFVLSLDKIMMLAEATETCR